MPFLNWYLCPWFRTTVSIQFIIKMQDFLEYAFGISNRNNIKTAYRGRVCDIYTIDKMIYIQAFFFILPRKLLVNVRHIRDSMQSKLVGLL